MRDRLATMQAISEEQEDCDPHLDMPALDANEMALTQEAVVFQGSSPHTMQSILEEAHSMRKEISLLHLEVERLVSHNERFGTTVRRLTVLKQDSDTIAREIQHRGMALNKRLQELGDRSRALEQAEGPHTATARISRTQHAMLSRAFHDVMANYHQAEETLRGTCRGRLQRNASILGRDMSGEELDTLVEKGGEGWAELSQSLQTDGAKSSRWAMSEVKGRHKDLVELEARLREVHELFLHMALLVEEQGDMINSIASNVCGTEEYIEVVNVKIKAALRYKKKNPCLQCCPCLPCWSSAM